MEVKFLFQTVLKCHALNYASQFDQITDHERHIIMHAKNSILVHKQQPWQKTGNTFDVTMGSYDGSETCELVGCFLLSRLDVPGLNGGLYRDDGLATSNAKPRELENIKKKLCQIFKENGLRITIEANKKIVNFLDVTLNLNTGTYMPYTKPNATIQYVHHDSNHPPTVIKNIPAGINRRLSMLTSDKTSFTQAAIPYQKALNDSGYNYKLHYEPDIANKQRKRKRDILWYNPPYSLNVQTNIGRKFLSLIDKHFPKHHILGKIFNRNTVKVSYSCMNNTKQIIEAHNKRLLKQTTQSSEIKDQQEKKMCNCRQTDQCPLQGRCLQTSVVYQATVTRKDNNATESYIGQTSTEFKTRYRNHIASFKNVNNKYATELSKYIWTLKDKNIDYNVSWRVLAQCQAYDNKTKRCNLCLKEKHLIICKPQLGTLNKRNELVSSCRHRHKLLLSNN